MLELVFIIVAFCVGLSVINYKYSKSARVPMAIVFVILNALAILYILYDLGLLYRAVEIFEETERSLSRQSSFQSGLREEKNRLLDDTRITENALGLFSLLMVMHIGFLIACCKEPDEATEDDDASVEPVQINVNTFFDMICEFCDGAEWETIAGSRGLSAIQLAQYRRSQMWREAAEFYIECSSELSLDGETLTTLGYLGTI